MVFKSQLLTGKKKKKPYKKDKKVISLGDGRAEGLGVMKSCSVSISSGKSTTAKQEECKYYLKSRCHI